MAPAMRLICPWDSRRRKRTEAPRHLSLRRLPPEGPTQKYRSLSEIFAAAPAPGGPATDYTSDDDYTDGDDYADVRCEECRSGDAGSKMLLCDKCDRGFHLFCLRPIVVRVPTGSWLCPRCVDQKPLREFRITQTKILDFFRIQKANCSMVKSPSDLRKRRRRPGQLVVSKKKRRRLLPFTPSTDPDKKLKQMGSVAVALRALQMKFSDELTYVPGMASRSANAAKLEKGGMQVLSKENAHTLELCKAMSKRGEWPPLLVVFDPCEGFTVEADGHIKDMTLIAEYTGDVDYLKNRENDDSDSMMTLLLGENSSDSLVICPDKRGNIARFINGINNHTPEGRKKQNLKCVRYSVNGECRVLIVANRDIAKGERLYYDYNGYEHEYPTEHFV